MKTQHWFNSIFLSALIMGISSGCDSKAKFTAEQGKTIASNLPQQEGNQKPKENDPPPTVPPVVTPDPPIPDPDTQTTTLTSIPIETEIVNLPIQLSLVIDDSSSMRPKQELLSLGLEKAFRQLRGKNVEVSIYSTSMLRSKSLINTFTAQTPGSSVKLTYSGISTGIYNSLSSKPAFHTVTEILTGGTWTTLTSPNLTLIPDEVRTLYQINKSGFSTPSGRLSFTEDMSQAAFNSLLAKLKTEVTIGDKGAPNEMPLCTVAELLANDGPNKIFGSHDRAAFLIITDEDQATGRPCLEGSITKVDKTPRYNARVQTFSTSIYIPTQKLCDEDGTTTDWCTSGVGARALVDCKDNSLCDPHHVGYSNTTKMACTPAQDALYKAHIAKFYQKQFDAGTMRYTPGSTCQTWNGKGAYLENVRVTQGFTKTTPITIDAVTYPSLQAYMQTKYPNSLYTGDIYVSYGFEPPTIEDLAYPGVSKPEDLPAYLRNRAKSLFGAGNFLFSVIGNLGANNPTGCSLSNDDASNLVLRLADVKSSVCDTDYSKNLGWLEQFSSRRMKPHYEITDPRAQEALSSGHAIILVKSNADTIALKSGDDYAFSVATNTLTLTRNLDIAANWTLEVAIQE